MSHVIIDCATCTESIRPMTADEAAAYAAAGAAHRAAETERQASVTARVATLHERAETAVGAHVDRLSTAQIRALLAVLLDRAGAIGADGNVKPLNAWGRD